MFWVYNCNDSSTPVGDAGSMLYAVLRSIVKASTHVPYTTIRVNPPPPFPPIFKLGRQNKEGEGGDII